MRAGRSLKLVAIAWLACGAWLGCNAILGNESAEFDPDAAPRPDATTDDGTSPKDDGATGDGSSSEGGDASLTDADADAGDGATPCVDLTSNPLHCGACNHDCRGGDCVDGGCRPVILATDLPGPDSIAIDSTHLYWINSNTNDIWSVQLDGGSKAHVYDGPDAAAGTSLALFGGNVYFASAADLDASVMRCPTPACDGGAQVVVPNRDVPVSVYVTATGQLHFAQTGPSGTLERCLLPCTLGTQVLASGAAQPFPDNVAVNPDGVVFWTTLNGSPTKMNKVVPLSGAPTSIAQGSIGQIVPTNTEAYYMDDTNGPSVVPLDGGPSRRLRTISTHGRYLALDTNVVYATEDLNDFVYACDRTNGCGDAGVMLATNQPSPRGIAFDATFIYWANFGNIGTGGQIMRLAR